MFRRHMLVALLGLAVVGPAPVVVADRFPLTVSPDGRRLLDGQGRPFLYHADTAWMLPLRLTLEEDDFDGDGRSDVGPSVGHGLSAFAPQRHG